MSRRQLARACGMRWRDLVRLELGRSDPDLHRLRRLCAALGATLGTLMAQLANQEYIAEVGGIRKLRKSATAGVGKHLEEPDQSNGTISPLPLPLR